METAKQALDLYDEYAKNYAKHLQKIMRLTDTSKIKRSKSEFEQMISNYIEQFKAIDTIPFYENKLLNDIELIKSKF